MLTEELHAASVLDMKVAEHEDAAHEKRNWVRLTYDCNNRCIFCLDSDTHDGEMRDVEEVKRQILDGRRKGATRLILSGGEPTIHPSYVDFIKLGRLAGYRRVQTVTNGRLFAYPGALERCLEAGLQEITFSLHGPNARIHDALVGVKGAFEQEVAGLKRALADGRPIVNVDIVINRGNVKTLPEMLDYFYGVGVREFDLLQVIPFGRAFTEGKDTLFYDLEEAEPYIQAALRFSQRPDVHVWFNRFPPPHLEGFEHLIQDPYKLHDEVRGRKEEFTRQLERGEPLDCRDPSRCRYCYLELLCDTLEETQTKVHTHAFERLHLDAAWEAGIPPIYGGDPASSRRAQDGPRPGKRQLPVFGGSTGASLEVLPLGERAKKAAIERLSIAAPDLASALEVAEGMPAAELELALDDITGLEAALDADGSISGRRLARVTAPTPEMASALLAIDASFEVEVLLDHRTGEWLLSLEEVSPRLALRQPTYDRLTEAAERDIDLPAFFSRFTAEVPVEGVPACILGRAPRVAPETFDTTMARPDGSLEIFRYTKRYILDHYTSKSLRCRRCVHDASCKGLHINQVRAHGYRWISPIESELEADAAQ